MLKFLYYRAIFSDMGRNVRISGTSSLCMIISHNKFWHANSVKLIVKEIFVVGGEFAKIAAETIITKIFFFLF